MESYLDEINFLLVRTRKNLAQILLGRSNNNNNWDGATWCYLTAPNTDEFPQSAYAPRWLEMALGVKRGTLPYPPFEKMKAKMLCSPICRHKVTSPFSALPAQRIWPAIETSYDRASATCVCEYTDCCTQVLYFTSLLG